MTAPARRHRPRTARLGLVAGVLALAALLVGCADDDDVAVTADTTRTTDPTGSTGSTGGGSDDVAAQLAAGRALWDDAGLDDYSFTLSVVCFCVEDLSDALVVDVADDVVVRAVDPTGREVDHRALDLPTVDDLFDEAEAHADHPDELLELELDPDLGYPTLLSLDPLPDAIDDEVGYRLTGLEPVDSGGGGSLDVDLAAARARWLAAGIDRYAVEVDVSCGECDDPTSWPVRITVEDGEVTAVDWAVVIDADQLPPEPSDVDHLTVEALFETIAGATDLAEVRFDPGDGHPTLVDRDEPEITDDEVHIEVLELTPLP